MRLIRVDLGYFETTSLNAIQPNSSTTIDLQELKFEPPEPYTPFDLLELEFTPYNH